MLRYLAKRLLQIPPTMLGIVAITFLLVHLAPGDPVAAEDASGGMSRSAITAEAVEQNRRLFFLNLPIFFDADVPDAARTTDQAVDVALAGRWLEAAGRPAAAARVRAKALARMKLRGEAAAPYLFGRLAELRGVFPPVELAALLRGATEHAVDWTKPGAPDPAAFDWAGWWTATGAALFTPERRAAAVAALVAAPPAGDTAGPDPSRPWTSAVDAATVAAVRALGRYAVPDLVRALGDSAALDGRLCELLSDALGREVTFKPGGPAAERDATVTDWEEWWYQNELEYRDVRGFYKVTGFFTQTQFWKWMSRVALFNFGASTQDGRPVLDKLTEALKITLVISLLSVLLSYLIAVPLGVFSAVRRDTPADRISTVGLFLLYSLPNFWAAVLLMRLFANPAVLNVLPMEGLTSAGHDALSAAGKLADYVKHLVLPVFCLTYPSLASLSRYQRVAMLDVVRQDYIRTARAKGLSERVVVLKHALRNALIPIITLLGLQIPLLIGGSVIVEYIFNIPGMGRLAFTALLNRDYPVIMAIATLTGLLTMIGVLVSDLLYAVADPRISYEGK
jgi:peptide/nickel transport system permease protein